MRLGIARLRTPAAYVFAVAVGAAATTQAAINARLGTKLDSAMMSSTFSFLSASVLLVAMCMIALYRQTSKFRLFGWTDKPTPLELTGGVWGAIFVASAVFLTPELGFAMFFVLLVAGQLFASLLLDTFGWFGAQKQSTTKPKLLAIAITYIGATLSVIERLIDTFNGEDDTVSPGLVAPFALFAFVGGACLPLQGAINGKMSKKLPSKLHATMVSFLVGTVGCFVGLGVSLIIDDAPIDNFSSNASDAAWWNWVGGPFGIFVVIAAIVGPMMIGFANYYVCVIAGQLVLSLIFDNFGLLGFAENTATALRIVGVSIVLFGVVMLQYVKKRQANLDAKASADKADQAEQTTAEAGQSSSDVAAVSRRTPNETIADDAKKFTCGSGNNALLDEVTIRLDSAGVPDSATNSDTENNSEGMLVPAGDDRASPTQGMLPENVTAV